MVVFAIEYYKKVKEDKWGICCEHKEGLCVFLNVDKARRIINKCDATGKNVCSLGYCFVHDIEKRKKELGAV